MKVELGGVPGGKRSAKEKRVNWNNRKGCQGRARGLNEGNRNINRN